MNPIAYSVVIPVYNSAPVLALLYRRLSAVMESLGDTFEMIFVDDASIDTSWLVLADIARNDRRIVTVQLAHNVGQGLATLTGLRRSSGEILITMDDDLQHIPEEIPRLVAHLRGSEKYDVIFGVPITRRHPLWRRSASWICNAIFSPVLRKPFSLRFSAFRVMRRANALRVTDLRWEEPFLSALLLQTTPRVGTLRVEHGCSALAATRYSIRKLARIPLAHFGGITDRARRCLIGVAIGMGIGLELLAYGAFRAGSDDGKATMFGLAAALAGIMACTFGLLAIAAGRRLTGTLGPGRAVALIQRIISDGREVEVNV